VGLQTCLQDETLITRADEKDGRCGFGGQWRGGNEIGDAFNESLTNLLAEEVGLTFNHSFKVKRTINDVEVVVLVDCEATTNFISRKLTRLLNLKVQNTTEFEVEVGTREKLKNRGICHNCDWR